MPLWKWPITPINTLDSIISMKQIWGPAYANHPHTWPLHFMHTCRPHLIHRGTSHWIPLHLHHLRWQSSGRHRHGLVGSWGNSNKWSFGQVMGDPCQSALCSPGPHLWSPPHPCRSNQWRHHLCEWWCNWCWRQLQCWGCSELSQWLQGYLTALQKVQ